MAEANPMMKEMLSDPELLKSMMNPDSISQAMKMMGGMGGPMGMPPGMGMPGMGMPGMGGFPGMPGMGMPGMGMPGMGMPGMGMPGMGMPGMGMPGMFPGMGMPGMGMNPMMMSMMGANPFGPRPGQTSASATQDSSKPPKERFAEEIQLFKSLGISDEELIIKALTESNGSVEGAMMKIMS